MGVFSLYDANGKLQFNDELLTYALRRTGAIATVAGFDQQASILKVPSIAQGELVAVSGGSGYAAGVYSNSSFIGQRWFVTDAPVGTVFNYFVFTTSDYIPESAFALTTYNAAGKPTFSTAQRGMIAPELLQNVSRNYAPSYSLPARQLAFCLLGYGGFKEYDGEDPDSGGMWYNHRWYSYGAAVSAGSTVTTRPIASVDGRFFTSGAYPPGPTYDTPCSILVVDVTNAPIGATFF